MKGFGQQLTVILKGLGECQHSTIVEIRVVQENLAEVNVVAQTKRQELISTLGNGLSSLQA